jgi:hypothetical protein
MSEPVKTYPLQSLLELACAAQRTNGSYVKQAEAIVTSDNAVVGYKWPNRSLMTFALGEDGATYSDPLMRPTLIKPTMEDRAHAVDIQKFYRRLAFTAIEGTDEFKTTLNGLLNSGIDVPANKLGFIACLPGQYARDYAMNRMERLSKTVDDGYLATIGSEVDDLDCEIIECKRSKAYDAYNIDAIIDNKMVSWMGKNQFTPGPCVVIRARVKDHTRHWKYANAVTRLNYVKAAQ